ncbi:MAG: amidase [Rhizobiaceae bacterium]|nr:amidase [Rhizobiaceae bacterium]
MADLAKAATYQTTEDAVTLSGRIRRRELSAQAAVGEALDRIHALNGTLAAFCTLGVDQAMAQAEAVDKRLAAGESVGALAGVPVAIKDLISTRGLRTTFGSPLYSDNVPNEDDIAVERLRAAGAIVVGKTNTSEFGYGAISHNNLFPATRNPWNIALTPGGSSAGSASAVAAAMLPIALGSDGGGSIRVPAGLTGTFGIKPSWGRVPVYPGCRDETQPGASGWESLEHIGPITRTVADAALTLQVLSGPSPRDRHSLPQESIDWTDLSPGYLAGRRIAFSADLGFAPVDAEVAAITHAAAMALAEAFGAELEFTAPEIEDTQDLFLTLVALDTDRAGLRAMAASQNYQFTRQLAELLDTSWSADAFTDAIMQRKRFNNLVWQFMERFDLFLTPTTATAAFPINCDGPTCIDDTRVAQSAWTPFSALANLTGLPAASVPAGFTKDGRPVGLQIMGRHLDDLGVLRAAAGVEQIKPWRNHWPEIVRGSQDVNHTA